jgi:hypothetical protein
VCQTSSQFPIANLRDDAGALRSSHSLATPTFEAAVTVEVNGRLGGFVRWFRLYSTDAALARSRLRSAGMRLYHF